MRIEIYSHLTQVSLPSQQLMYSLRNDYNLILIIITITTLLNELNIRLLSVPSKFQTCELILLDLSIEQNETYGHQ